MKDEVHQGKIKQYDSAKGFGFIGTAEGDIFFHISDFPAAEGEPKRNERVQFIAVENGDKFKAVKIARVEKQKSQHIISRLQHRYYQTSVNNTEVI